SQMHRFGVEEMQLRDYPPCQRRPGLRLCTLLKSLYQRALLLQKNWDCFLLRNYFEAI
ncbi:hypothetical protein FOC4_g10000971, partial [Fusarium odoratissimum]